MSGPASPVEIAGGVELPARREDVELHTADGLTLVGELARAQAMASGRRTGMTRS